MSTKFMFKSIGTIIRQTAPFNEALESVYALGAKRILTFAEMAEIRLAVGGDHLISKADSFVQEAIIYTPSNQCLFVRQSPLMKVEIAHKAALANRKLETADEARDPIHLTGWGEINFGEVVPMELFNDFLNQAEEDKNKPVPLRRVLLQNGIDAYRLITDSFGKSDLAIWLFGSVEKAEEYGSFLRKKRVFGSMVWLVEWLDPNPARAPYLRQMNFGSLNGDSCINGARRLGWDDGHLSGVWGVA